MSVSWLPAFVQALLAAGQAPPLPSSCVINFHSTRTSLPQTSPARPFSGHLLPVPIIHAYFYLYICHRELKITPKKGAGGGGELRVDIIFGIALSFKDLIFLI